MVEFRKLLVKCHQASLSRLVRNSPIGLNFRLNNLPRSRFLLWQSAPSSFQIQLAALIEVTLSLMALSNGSLDGTNLGFLTSMSHIYGAGAISSQGTENPDNLCRVVDAVARPYGSDDRASVATAGPMLDLY